MSADLPWTVVILYTALSVCANRQKVAVRKRVATGGEPPVLLGAIMATTSIFGIGYLVTYGIKVSWWPPLVLFAIGLLAWPLIVFVEAHLPDGRVRS
jgi:hypothetical protein